MPKQTKYVRLNRHGLMVLVKEKEDSNIFYLDKLEPFWKQLKLQVPGMVKQLLHRTERRISRSYSLYKRGVDDNCMSQNDTLIMLKIAFLEKSDEKWIRCKQTIWKHGHTFCFQKDDQLCNHCNQALRIKHILVKCQHFPTAT